jgi:abhydrolase domain-containing protein 6
MRAAVERGENPLLTRSVDDVDRVLEFVMHRRLAIPGFLKRYLARLAMASTDFNARIFAQYAPDGVQGLEHVLPQIAAPTLILWGRQDRVLDVSSLDVMRPLMPHAKTVVLEDTGHLPQVERPLQAAAHLRALIGDTP